jgi:two-component system, sensor histidine kinase RpfC
MAGSVLGTLAGLRARLAARPDTEHEQAIVRLVNTCAFGIYLLPELSQDVALWSIYLVYTLTGAAILADIFLRPAESPARRVLGALADVAMLTWALIQFGEGGAPLFLVFLWITLANGFRFGANYLVLTLVLSVAGFGAVLAFSDFWITHRALGIGLMVGLIALSLYVRKLVTQLFDALARAEEANQAKRRFISVVSHEMRTPLNAIIGMADLLRDTPLTREQADMLQTLRSSSRLMLGLVDDVLDFSKIEAGKVVLAKADFDLHALVNSTCRILSAQAAAKGIEFVVSLMPEVPPAVRGDPHALRQVLINLAGNSVKFTDQGSVTLHVSVQSESETGVRLKFSIRDTGIGIAPEAQTRIFESFVQADESTSRRFGGTGLGTTIARQLVVLMGGRIGLESAVGLGSTFWFEVALDKQAERSGAGSGELADARVLLVGFPQSQRGAVEQALGGWGATAVVVANVEEALARVVAEISLAKPFHSVLIWSDGDLKLLQRFRRGAPNPAPPVVLAVPRDADVPRFDALSAGSAALLEMPFDKRLLFNVLHSVSAGEEIRDGVIRLQDYARRGGAAKKLRILVADDNPTNREVLSKILSRGGHAVTVQSDGDDALDAVERERFDVVILDRNMPRTGGIEALQAIRVMSAGRERIPVIILSADVTPEAKREAFEAGADAFLPKPIEAMRLLDEVQSAAGLRQDAKRGEPSAMLSPARAAQGEEAQVLNLETLAHLEELGSSDGFIKRLAGVFIADNTELLARIERSVAARDWGELRSHLHAMKGSSASLGTDRLSRLCTAFGAHSDAELRLQGTQLVRALSDELDVARTVLERYVQEKQQSAS